MRFCAVLIAVLGTGSFPAFAQESPYVDSGSLDHSGDEVTCLAFHPDGKILVTGGQSGVVRLWDLTAKKEIHQIRAHAWAVSSLAFRPDGKRFITGSQDRTAKIWDVESRQELHTLSGHKNWVTAVAFSGDGKTAATGGLDGRLMIWNAENGELVRTHKPDRKVSSLSFRPGGRILLSGLRDKDFNIKIWDLETGKEIDPLKAESDPLLSGLTPEEVQRRAQEIEQRLKEDVERIRKTEEDPTKRMEEIARIEREAHARRQEFLDRQEALKRLREDLVRMVYKDERCALPNEEVVGLSFFDGGKRLATGGVGGGILLWDLGDRSVRTAKLGCAVNCFAATSDGRWLACGGTDYPKHPYYVKILDGAKGEVVATFSVHDFSVTCVAFSADGAVLASGSNDRTVHLWTRRK